MMTRTHRHTEIADLGMRAVFIQQDVLALQVSVDDAVFVQEGDARRDFGSKALPDTRIEGVFFLVQPGVQAASAHEFASKVRSVSTTVGSSTLAR